MYWGEMIYATPGCGKTFVADKYRDVVDGDDLIVEAIREVAPNFAIDTYDDPRKVIYQYFRYIHFNRRLMWRVYNRALEKMRDACAINDVVLFGTLDLMDEADRLCWLNLAISFRHLAYHIIITVTSYIENRR